ncbi:protein SCAI [Manduca sexta]|uniref:protein SCAI n=1 Tax=Manduca sexta TaxID=7130 RepID=UPI0011844904|nr:protein SCAI [Manduca sexta]
MAELVEEDRKLIIEFCHLLDKAKQLFNGLRELPQYGHKQWHSYFGRTFDVYTKLWKFQQQHRAVLDSKYGLKRWQIGEIASKIGQLYYHFYLRTSECAYLNEAFSFYSAIRGRSYYTKACKEDKCELIVKKLRYYARFIVVCLLLKKIKLVRELIKELERQIAEYGNTYDPDDQVEWTLVVDEVKAFIQAEQVVTILHPDNYAVVLSHRLGSDSVPSIERSSQMAYNLQEAMIIGNRKYQVKFSELAIDMFRIIQTLERDPIENAQHIYDESPRQRFASTPNAPTTKGYLEEASRRESANPHKILLYKPAANQALVYIGSGVLDLLPNGALLLYISGDGYTCSTPRSSEPGYDMGGVITTYKSDTYRDGKDQKSQTKYKEVQCIYPGDLFQFSRSPMFIIIDSDNSFAFANMPKIFGYPQVTLMSPIELPVPYQDHKHQGSLFTLFLHAPLIAFCYICEIRSTSLAHWERALIFIDNFMIDALNILMRNRPDLNYVAFIGDDFMRLLILRYIFCDTTLRLHRAFRPRNTQPRCSPPLPDELIDHPALTGIVLDIANHFQVR